MPHLPLTGACDSHVHVVGSVERFPQLADRTYTAGPAELDSLRAASEHLGVTRFVAVQPSFYGTDNSRLLAALEALGERGRGVAVIDLEAATSSLLAEYGRLGVRGVRLNLYSPMSAARSNRLEDALASWAEKLPRTYWHIEVVSSLSVLNSARSAIACSSVPIVIDHYGLPGKVAPESREGRGLVDLVSLPHVWVKLSAPYRIGGDPLATAPPTAWLSALLRVAPDRCVWGSDWPHSPAHGDQKGLYATTPYRTIEYARLLGDFVGALPDGVLARRILIDNPMRLYGFAPD